MPGDERHHETSRWLQYAEEDLALAQRVYTDAGVPRHSCQLAQQAAEKALKAGYAWLDIAIPRSHDLEYLQSQLPADWHGRALPVEAIAELSLWAVESRYPTAMPDAESTDAVRALQIALQVVEAIRQDLLRLGFGG
jgi:HEPN domain-containing protein